MSRNIRDYGLGESTSYVDGIPRILGDEDIGPCPNCGCEKLFSIEVDIKNHPLLRDGNGVGHYLGCAACPFASPMIMIAQFK